MSKLAAVRTGQPTQGIGSAPNGNPPSVSIDESDLAAFVGSPASINPRSPYAAQSANLTAQWLSLEAKEIEVRKYFRSIPVPSGLEMLAKMRKQCDMAAETLQQRMDEGNTERCTGCNKTLEEARKSSWIMVGADVDPETGVPMPYRFCGPLCVRERNREKMLPKELRDQKRVDGADIADVR